MENIKLNLPYCEAKGEICNLCMANLQEAYSGRTSEATAILQYSYQSYILKIKYPELSKMLEEIAITEMLHHELLAKAIIAFGGDPIIAGKFAFFSGSYIDYVKNPKDIIIANIQAEKQAIIDYRKLMTTCNNETLNELISRIIMDEELHVSIFEKVLCSLDEK